MVGVVGRSGNQPTTRLYELARKHCGRQQTWRISLDLLRKKCGSGSTLKEFKRMISKVIEDDIHTNHLPDYSILGWQGRTATQKPLRIDVRTRQTGASA